MKHLLILLFLIGSSNAFAQQQEEIWLDSCYQLARQGETAFESVYVRVQQEAEWNNKKETLSRFIDRYFEKYVQKRAGGKITFSILIHENGSACLYKVQPNTNVHPDYREFKDLVGQTTWKPALQNNQPVRSIKVLFVYFEGKSVTVKEMGGF